MTAVRWSPQAVDDLAEIVEFVALDSPEAARVVAGQIVAAVEQLAEFPLSGRPYLASRDPVMRELVRTPYVLVYQILDGAVQVVAVDRSSRKRAPPRNPAGVP